MSAFPAAYVNGKPVTIAKRIGRGGEGEVFALSDGAALKVYGRPDAVRETKVKAMIAAELAKRSPLAAFPLAVATDKAGRFIGFTMRQVNGHTSLHELYSPGSRKVHFPKADYRFTIRAASNIARAVAQSHELGVVIGDINHSGILISDQAVSALIDADSFQFGAHRCRVGVAEYTPPELQGMNLETVERTRIHDAFGLAIVIFQLLFMGRHPYVGRYSAGEMPMEKAVSEHRFAYSANRNVGMIPPPGACTLKDFPEFIADAFERAFSTSSHTRPSAAEWVSLLGRLEGALTKCGGNAMHFFPTASRTCIWCRMEEQIGILLFIPDFTLTGQTAPAAGAAGFNLAQVWASIERVRVPDPASLSPVLPSRTLEPSKDAKGWKWRRLQGKLLGAGVLVGAVLVLIAAAALWPVWGGMAWFGVAKLFSSEADSGRQFSNRYSNAARQYLEAVDHWQSRIGYSEIQSLKRSLIQARDTLQGLPAEEKERLAELETGRRDRQLHSHLEKFPIWRANIRGIGPAKVATLASYGIDTAADMVKARVLNVPGFGPTSAKPLLEWRDRVAAKFVFRAERTPTDVQDAQRVRQSCQAKAIDLQMKLLKGAADLNQAAVRFMAMSKAADPILQRKFLEREQAMIDLRHLGIPVPPVTRTPSKTNIPYTSPSPAVRTPHKRSNLRTANTRPNATATPAGTAKPCPTCGGRMVKRLARRGRNAGNYFWGCAAYPGCKGTRSI